MRLSAFYALGLLLFLVSCAACDAESESNVSSGAPKFASIIKVLVYEDDTITINNSLVKAKNLENEIRVLLVADSEIWLWLEEPLGFPKGSALIATEIVSKYARSYTTKMYINEDFSGDYVSISIDQYAD